MRGYVSRFLRRLRHGPERAALDKIAVVVWGPSGSSRLAGAGGVGDLVSEVERRIPRAIAGELVSETIRGALCQGVTLRFRAFISADGGDMLPGAGKHIEVGVYVEGRNVTFTQLAKGGHSPHPLCPPWESIVGEVAGWRPVEGREVTFDGAGRLVEWVRFAAP